MATAEQIKALIRNHLENNNDKFVSSVMQIAANEAKKGHEKFAKELKELLSKFEDNTRDKIDSNNSPVPITRPAGELSDLLSASYPDIRLSDMILDDELKNELFSIIQEQRELKKIKSHGLEPKRKLLFIGPPGCGKTMSASALAGELGIPLFTVRLDGLLNKYLGETSSKLKLIFDEMENKRGIYFFDEFDSIGSGRDLLNDVGEIRRVLNSFLIYLENDNSNSLIIAATNFVENLDYALFRRFHSILEYEKPNKPQVEKLIRKKLSSVKLNHLNMDELKNMGEGLSYAEITQACEETLKDKIMEDKAKIDRDEFVDILKNLETFGN